MTELIAGHSYETTLTEKEVGKVLYLGSSYKSYRRWSQSHHGCVHILVFRNGVGGIECKRFNEYELPDGKLKIRVFSRQKISPLEREFIDELLKKAGL